MGERTGRYALIIDHGKITYAEKEASGSDVSVGSCYKWLNGANSLRFPALKLSWRNYNW